MSLKKTGVQYTGRVENEETPPTSIVAGDMLQNSGTLYTLAFTSTPFMNIKRFNVQDW